MLKFIRKKGHMRKVLWFVASLIVLSFGLLGQNYAARSDSQSNYAGKVFGRKISLEDFQYNFGQTQLQAMIQYGAEFNRIRNLLDLRSQTWDRIILLQETNRRRIRVKDNDVVRAIEAYNIFQRDGRFEKKLYDDILRFGFRIKPREFEEGVRDTLKFTQLFDQETRNVSLSEQDVFTEYRMKNEKAEVSYALVPWEKFSGEVTADEAKVKDYFLAHKDEFNQPPMVRVDFVRVDFPKKGAVPDQKADTTKQDTTAKADVSEEDKNATFEKARKLLEDLTVNSDLAAVAQQNNLKVESSGFFSMENPELKNGWPFPLIQDMFLSPVGQALGPAETPQGYQVVVVKEKKDAQVPGYEAVKEIAKKAWVKNEAMQLAQKKADEYQKLILAAYAKDPKSDFAQVAKGLGLEVDQTPLFQRGQYLPKIGLSREFHMAAFALTADNKISAPVPTDKGYCVLHLNSLVQVDPKEYEKQRNEFMFALLRERKNMVFSEYLARLRLKANLEDNLPKTNVLPE